MITSNAKIIILKKILHSAGLFMSAPFERYLKNIAFEANGVNFPKVLLILEHCEMYDSMADERHLTL